MHVCVLNDDEQANSINVHRSRRYHPVDSFSFMLAIRRNKFTCISMNARSYYEIHFLTIKSLETCLVDEQLENEEETIGSFRCLTRNQGQFDFLRCTSTFEFPDRFLRFISSSLVQREQNVVSKPFRHVNGNPQNATSIVAISLYNTNLSMEKRWVQRDTQPCTHNQ